jgi:hypothetical protein
MSVIKRKNRMISFRLSDEEYDALRTVCQSHGVRSLSDFARLAIENLMAGDGFEPQAAVRSRLEALSSRVQVLDLAVGRLAEFFNVHNRPKEAVR